MTEQTDAAEVEALADFAEWHTGPPNDIYVLQGHQLRAALAAREAAAEARGAERALREAADDWPEDGMTRAEAQQFLAVRAAAAGGAR